MTKTKQDRVIALFCSDLHLSLTPPPLRSKEPDWFKAMLRPIEELKALQEKHDCPIFCAGDIFDKWNSSPEVINFAMEHLPYMHCIPGQHDLPEHDLGQIERSAYWTLKTASVIDNRPSVNGFTSSKWPGLAVHAFPFGSKVTPRKGSSGSDLRIALIHQYNWIPGHVYHDGPPKKESHVDEGREEFQGYDLVVSGDNHSPFDCMIGKTRFVNCGTFMRRLSKEVDYYPSIWMLKENGSVQQHYLDTSKDVYLDTATAKVAEESTLDLSELVRDLSKLGECALDFVANLKQVLEVHPTRRAVRELLLKASEDE